MIMRSVSAYVVGSDLNDLISFTAKGRITAVGGEREKNTLKSTCLLVAPGQS